MTGRIVTVVCVFAILVGAVVILLWNRVQPTTAELAARGIEAQAKAAAAVAQSRAEAAEQPTRERAVTLAILAGALGASILLVGGSWAGVRWLHGRAAMSVVTWAAADNAVIQAPASAMVITAKARPDLAPVPTAPMIQSPERSMLPAPSYAALLASGWRPTADNLILGIGQSGPIYGRLSDLLSCGVLGRPGSGKTSLLRLVAVQACAVGVKVIAFDPHGGLDLVGVEVASSMGEIAELAQSVMGELDRRIAARRPGQPLLVLADELPAWAAGSESGRQCLRRIVLEGRKYGCFAYVGGQTLPAGLLDGVGVRDSLSSRYVFKSTPTVARQMLETEPSRRAIALEPGQALLDCARTTGPTVVSIPWVEAPGSTSRPVEVLPGSATSPVVLPGSGSGSSGSSDLSDLDRVRQLMDGGLSKTAAITAVVGATGGRRWGELAASL